MKKQDKPDVEDLPSFGEPPVVEVAIGVQFSNPVPFNVMHLHGLHEALGTKRFPSYQEMPLLDPILPFDLPMGALQFTFTMTELPRFWFNGETGEELVQVQRDRFIYNWRKPSDGKPDCYPRFGHVKDQFFTLLTSMEQYFNTLKISIPRPNMLELIYVNHVELPDDEIKNLPSMFKGIQPPPQNELFADAIGFRYNCLFATQKNMRTTIDLTTGQRIETGKPLIKFELAARIAPEPTGESDVGLLFDDARRWIVRAFDDITTPEAHKKWKKV